MQRWMILGVLLSLAVHVGIGVGVAAIPKDVATKHSLVSVFEKKKKKEEKKEPLKDEPPPPPPKPKEPPRAAPKPKAVVENTPPPPPANTPPPSAAAHPQLAALPNLGISMAGGPGGGVGIAVPPPQAEAPEGARTVEGLAPKPKPKDDDCTEPEVKATAIGVPPQPAYTDDAKSVGIEGRVRLSLDIDASGNVIGATVRSGLGHGLDQSAIAAARRAKFKPATRCGKPVASHFPLTYRFTPPE